MQALYICDDFTNCELCGKTNLKCTVGLLSPEEIVHWGRCCAAKYGNMDLHTSKAVENSASQFKAQAKRTIQFKAEQACQYQAKLKEIHRVMPVGKFTFAEKRGAIQALTQELNQAKEKAALEFAEEQGLTKEILEKVLA